MRRSLTKDSSCMLLYLQEECVKLINATVRGDMEVISTLISDGVDMNAIIHEVCITTIVVSCRSLYSYTDVRNDCYTHIANVEQ